MNKQTISQHFVTFLSPGTFVSEETTKPIASWDVEIAVAMARNVTERHNSVPYGFIFTTRSRSEKDLDSKEVKRSKCHYLGGRILTLADVKKEMPNESILISNMECNGIKRVIINTNSWRSVLPFDEGDTLLDVVLKRKEKVV